jgi:hypothetical protein
MKLVKIEKAWNKTEDTEDTEDTYETVVHLNVDEVVFIGEAVNGETKELGTEINLKMGFSIVTKMPLEDVVALFN